LEVLSRGSNTMQCFAFNVNSYAKKGIIEYVGEGFYRN